MKHVAKHFGTCCNPNCTAYAPMFRDPQQAFADAIATGRLSSDPSKANYAGHYMYMGPRSDGRGDAFKHRVTREYLRERVADCN